MHYNDPISSTTDEYHFDLCISVNVDVLVNTYAVITKAIPAEQCALVRHLGSRQNLTPARFLYYLNSGEKLTGFTIFLHYVNVGSGMLKRDMIKDEYLPIS